MTGELAINNLFPITPVPLLSNKEPLLTLTIQVKQVQALLDSGAHVSVLSYSVISHALHKPPQRYMDKAIRAFGGVQINLKGPVNLEVEASRTKIIHPFYFTTAKAPSILDYDLMKHLGLILDTPRNAIWLKSNSEQRSQSTDQSGQTTVGSESTNATQQLPQHPADTRCKSAAETVEQVHTAIAEQTTPSVHPVTFPLESPTGPVFGHTTTTLPKLSSDRTATDSDAETVRTRDQPPLTSTLNPEAEPFIGRTEQPAYIPDHVQQLYDRTTAAVSLSEVVDDQFRGFLQKYENTFARSKLDMGYCSLLQHDRHRRSPTHPAVSTQTITVVR